MARQGRIAPWVSAASPFEVVSLAIQMERGAVRQYARMGMSARSALLRAKFRYLAEEEREHARLLAGLRRNLRRPEKTLPIPRDFMAEATGTLAGDRISDALKLAIRNEVSAEAFYRNCAQRARKAGVRKLFNDLADREVRHKEFLQDELSQQTGMFPWRGLEGALPSEEDFWG